MRDRETELHYYPKDALSVQGISHALCIAPHPDDEVLGCGGALAMLVHNAVSVQSVIVTQGDKALGTVNQAHATERMDESCRAAQILGCKAPRFLDFEDRQLSYTSTLVEALSDELSAHIPASSTGLLLLPSLSEPHPDHQAVALAGLAAALNHAGPLRVLFYEVGAPLHPNTYLDITAVAQQKWQALACFSSQLVIENYEGLSRAMATLRAFGKSPECTAAEAYFEVDLNALRRSGPLAVLPQWPWVRSRLQLAHGPQDLPQVSVLIRSMDRPTLTETLASVAQQTYPHIEVIIVNATGRPHQSVAYMPAHLPVRITGPDMPAVLGRSAAANHALAQARGSLALFLDDDDLIAPDHLQRLVQTLHEHSQAVAAYTGARVVNADGQTVREYDIPWSNERLKGINFLPIHAVLFRMQEVRERQLVFDTTLPVLEDWDFWRQLSRDRQFVHCPGITATYRQSLGQSGLSDPGHDNHWQAWHLQLLTRYLEHSPIRDTAKALAWHAIELDKVSQQIQQAHEADKRRQKMEAELELQRNQSLQHQQARDQLQHEIQRFSMEVQARMAEKEAKLHAFAAESNQAHAHKDAQILQQAAQIMHQQQAQDRLQQEFERFSLEMQAQMADKDARYQALVAESNKALELKDQQIQQQAEALIRAQGPIQRFLKFTKKLRPSWASPQSAHQKKP